MKVQGQPTWYNQFLKGGDLWWVSKHVLGDGVELLSMSLVEGSISNTNKKIVVEARRRLDDRKSITEPRLDLK